jgi:hypothetical protein
LCPTEPRVFEKTTLGFARQTRANYGEMRLADAWGPKTRTFSAFAT